MEATEIRCVAVVDKDLAPGHAANAVGVMSITLGALVPELAGADLVDADGEALPGLIPQGITVLAASGDVLRDLRLRAAALGLRVIAMPTLGHQTNDYEEVRRRVAETPTGAVDFLGDNRLWRSRRGEESDREPSSSAIAHHHTCACGRHRPPRKKAWTIRVYRPN